MLLLKNIHISSFKSFIRSYSTQALEDWLYQNYDFSKQQILLLWRNNPTVVIGRHQNPWLESNVELVKTLNASIARRNSGGGTVYHDLENLNLSFFTSKGCYNRKYNLEIIINSLRNEWGMNCIINDREDILLNGKKVSGTASKLGSKNAYHHCTLLVDCNKTIMSAMLASKNRKISTSATRSIPSSVINLRHTNSSVNVNRLMTVIGSEYLSASSVVKSNKEDFFVLPKGFQLIFPEEKYFPGLNQKIQQFSSWEWIFSRTPKFKIEFTFSATRSGYSSDNVEIYLEVVNALVQKIDVLVPPSFLVFVTSESMSIITQPFLQLKFSSDLIIQIKNSLVDYFECKLQDQRLNSVL